MFKFVQRSVTVKQQDDCGNIFSSHSFLFQLLVEAQSTISGTKKITTTEVTINVKRNLNPPTFVQNDFFGQVRDISPIGYSITRISAKDNDNVSGLILLILSFMCEWRKNGIVEPRSNLLCCVLFRTML